VKLSARPLYLQLRDALLERIARGEWQPGQALPNESDLAREFGVSAGTMRKALDALEAERLLTRRQGRGTFVNDPNGDELVNRYTRICAADGSPMIGSIGDAEIETATANEIECLRLQLRDHAPVLRLARVRLNRGEPYLYEKVSLPAALFPNLSGTTSLRIVKLAGQYGLLLGAAEERLSIGAAWPEAATALGIAPGSPVTILDRVVRALDGRPVEWRLAQCDLRSNLYMARMH
jgi:GntR family transcriptional regulator